MHHNLLAFHYMSPPPGGLVSLRRMSSLRGRVDEGGGLNMQGGGSKALPSCAAMRCPLRGPSAAAAAPPRRPPTPPRARWLRQV